MFISVLTSTYNRASTLPRVFESLQRQTDLDFEWIVLDDGSTDGTDAVVESFMTDARFNIRYFKKTNEGKSRTLNMGYQLCKGEYTLTLDSDDRCVADCIAFFREQIELLPADSITQYSGISTLKRYASGGIVGDKHPNDLHDYVDNYNRRIAGDKWNLIRRDVALEFPFPVFGDERHIAESSMLLRIGQRYYTKFVNEAIEIVEYRNDGLSKNCLQHRISSPRSACYTYDLIYNISNNNKTRFRARVNLLRFCFHGGTVEKHNYLDLLAFPVALMAFIRDIFKLRYSG